VPLTAIGQVRHYLGRHLRHFLNLGIG